MYICFNVQVSVTRVAFSWSSNNLDTFSNFLNIFKYQISRKTYPVGKNLLHVDGQTDRHNDANSRFSQFRESA
jgi:hypothetical protein